MKILILLGILTCCLLFVLWTMLVVAKEADEKMETFYHQN